MSQFAVAPADGGRIMVGRLLPGSDLIGGLEAICDEHDIAFATVVSCYGSLSSASFKFLQIPAGKARAELVLQRLDERVEFMGGQGLICRTPEGDRDTHLHGSISDARGTLSGGHFVRGANPVYNNMDVVIQELHGVRLIREHDTATDTIEMRVERIDTDG